jgi:hypothetical protein
MGNGPSRNTHSIIPVENEEYYEIGILKNKNTDVNYHEVEGNLQLVDNSLAASPYQLSPQSIKSKHLKGLQVLISEERWKEDVLKPVLEIMHRANNKRYLLYQLVIFNPYLPWHKTGTEVLGSSYNSLLDLIDSMDLPLSAFNSLLRLLCALLIGFPLFLLSILQYSLFYLMDIFACRLSVFRGSERERDFITTIFKGNPDYDTVAIDETIGLEMYHLSKDLSEKFQQEVIVQYHFRRSKVVDDQVKDIYEQDYKYLLFIFRLQRSPSGLELSSEEKRKTDGDERSSSGKSFQSILI